MLTQLSARKITRQILQRCGGDPAEVLLFSREQALTRFANNAIHQNVAERDLAVYVRLFVDGRRGMASTNRDDPAALDELVARARANALASPPDPLGPGPAEPAEYSPVESFDPATAEFTPQGRAAAVASVCRLAGAKGLNASGAFATGWEETVVANSRGLFAYHAATEADFQTVVMAEDASGRAQASSWKAGDLPIEALAQEAIGKAERGRDPQPLEPGEYTVVCDSYVTADLLNMLNLHGMGAQAVLDGRSWMNGRQGEQAMSAQVNIWDDGTDPRGLPLPFDSEGMPRQRVEIVSAGVVQDNLYDRTTALKAGRASTGHAQPPNALAFVRLLGPIAYHLFMAPGDASLEGMIRSTERGLYITRFWYTRLVHPRDCVATGMTRDGVFLIENGEIARPVKNLRFTQSYVEALAGVEAVGKETRLLSLEGAGRAVRVPALKIGRFNFTGVTV